MLSSDLMFQMLKKSIIVGKSNKHLIKDIDYFEKYIHLKSIHKPNEKELTELILEFTINMLKNIDDTGSGIDDNIAKDLQKRLSNIKT